VKTHSEVRPRSDPSHAIAPDGVGRKAVVVIAIVASLGVLPWLEGSMFADEGATLYSGRLAWSDLWAQSQHVDLVLLPYYVLMHFWMLVSGNVAWVRAISLLAFLGTIIAVGWTGLRIAGRWCGIIAAVLTATSALLVEKSVNARPYELSTFLVVLCAVVLLRWLEHSRTRWLWAFSLLAILATALQLFSLLAPVAMLVSVLVIRPELLARRLRMLLAPVAVLAVVSCAWLIACIGEVGQVNWIANQSTGARLIAEVRGPVVGQIYDFILIVILVAAVTRLAVVWNGGGRLAVINRVSQDRDILALTVGWVAIPTIVLSLVSFVHPIFSVRYVAASAPAAALLSALLCVLVEHSQRRADPSVPSDSL
jgi:mannosyltransferase